MKEINVFEIIGDKAITLDAGIRLRDAIITSLENQTEEVLLDFNNVKQFTTMFFNSSIGYLVSYIGSNKVSEQIKFKNLSTLGQKSYDRSFKNAELKHENSSNDLNKKIEEIINNITEEI